MLVAAATSEFTCPMHPLYRKMQGRLFFTSTLLGSPAPHLMTVADGMGDKKATKADISSAGALRVM